MRAKAESFRFSNFIMNLIAKDMSEEDARRRARGTEGASIAWIVGHLLDYRYHLMNLLGSKGASPYAQTFGEGATGGADYPTMPELLEAWNETAEKLETAMADVGDAYLDEKPGGDSPHGEQTRLATVAFYAWHESYHVGQAGTLRRNMGYPATSDLAVAAAQGARS